MKARVLNRNKIESLIYGLIWMFAFAVPYLDESLFGDMNWEKIVPQWLHLSAFLVIFLINAYVLVPKLLFKQKYKQYFLYIALIVGIGIGINVLSQGIRTESSIRPPMMENEHEKRNSGEVMNRNKPPLMVFADNLIMLILILGAGTSSKLITKWLSEEKRRKDVEKEQLKTNLALLKNQISPHFLFNNLSVLTSLVYKNQDKAVDFINELSKVYRYVLDNNSSELVTLSEEIEFLKHYLYLLEIRFEKNIQFEIKIEENKIQTYILPMCLQMLVENTIQHNIASQANPLFVNIYTKNNYLIVENKIQRRSDVKSSSRTGLINIQSRYSFFTDEKIEVLNDDINFKVILPLISSK